MCIRDSDSVKRERNWKNWGVQLFGKYCINAKQDGQGDTREKKKAWRAYWALKQVFKGKMEVRSKIKILEACIYPVLTYGAQAWTLTQNQGRSLQATQRSMERSILYVKKGEKISNEVIRKRTGTHDILYQIRKLKIKFAGHVARHGGKRWSKRIIEWTLYEGKRTRGRPATRWRGEIQKHLGVTWQRAGRDRTAWTKIGEAFTQKWVLGGSWPA